MGWVWDGTASSRAVPAEDLLSLLHPRDAKVPLPVPTLTTSHAAEYDKIITVFQNSMGASG